MNKILIIEDETSLRENLHEILSLHDYEVIEAENGYVGIHKIFNERPNLVICDILMPEIDGYSVLKTVRDSRVFNNLPFIFLTAKTSHEELRLGMELGADDYITKPFVMNDLLKIIKLRLERNEAINLAINQKIEEYKKNLSTVYSHELYTGLTSIHMAADILIEHYQRMGISNLYDLFYSIKNAAERIERTLRNLQLYAEFSASGENAQIFTDVFLSGPTFFKNTLIDISEKYATAYKRTQDLKFSLNDCKLIIPTEHFSKIIEEIIDNAFKFSEIGTTVLVSSLCTQNTCTISVSNSGANSVDLNNTQFLAFQQYNRGVHEQQGNGLGLHIANKLIQFNKGKIEIDASQENFTTVKLCFPKHVD